MDKTKGQLCINDMEKNPYVINQAIHTSPNPCINLITMSGILPKFAETGTKNPKTEFIIIPPAKNLSAPYFFAKIPHGI